MWQTLTPTDNPPYGPIPWLPDVYCSVSDNDSVNADTITHIDVPSMSSRSMGTLRHALLKTRTIAICSSSPNPSENRTIAICSSSSSSAVCTDSRLESRYVADTQDSYANNIEPLRAPNRKKGSSRGEDLIRRLEMTSQPHVRLLIEKN